VAWGKIKEYSLRVKFKNKSRTEGNLLNPISIEFGNETNSFICESKTGKRKCDQAE